MDRHISVQGSGTSGAEPDTCQVDFRVGATAPSVAEATEIMSRAARTVMEALTNAGADQLSTARFTIRLEHDHQGQPAGFRAETSIRAVVGVESGSGVAASRLLGAAVEAGGDHLGVDGLTFQHSDPTSVEHEASRTAVADARARAEVMAEAAGVAVGKVISIEHTVHSGPGPLRFKAAMAEAHDMPVAPGTQTTTVEVRVTFALS
ncbi:MAG: SIMPL domain-containing protein [Acidimicrobiia bacterium]